jgi:adenine-specific DNA-methyltransferase
MNTLNYIGCKNKLSQLIIKIIVEKIGKDNLKEMNILDLFAGTGIMSYKFKDICGVVNSNDLEEYSYLICNSLKCPYSGKIQSIIDEANGLEPAEGLLYKNFSPNNECERMFFTSNNAKRIDAMRIFIEEKMTFGNINIAEWYFLMASLLVSMDKVANTSVVYGAYLKKFKASANKNIILVPIHKDKLTASGTVSNKLAEELVAENKYDIVYIDPPYNSRQYSANYFLLNYLVRYDSKIEITGKTGLVKNYNRSKFSSKVAAKNTFKEMIDNINAKYIVLSYNDEGIISKDDLKNILCSKGSVVLYKIKYAKFKAQKNIDKKYICEYLWTVEVNDKIVQENFKEQEVDSKF